MCAPALYASAHNVDVRGRLTWSERVPEVVVEVQAVPQEPQQEAERKGLRRKPHVCLLALWTLLVFFLTCLSQPALLRPLHPERVTHGQEHLEPLLQSREELHSMHQAWG